MFEFLKKKKDEPPVRQRRTIETHEPPHPPHVAPALPVTPTHQEPPPIAPPALPVTPTHQELPPSAPPADHARLSDILSAVIAKHEQEQQHARQLQELIFFKHELERIVYFLQSTTRKVHLWQGIPSGGTLTEIVDTVTDLNAELASTFAISEEDAASCECDSPPLDVPIPAEILSDSETDAEILQIDLDGMLYEVRAIHESLAKNEALLALYQKNEPDVSENLRNVIGAICAILPKLLRECLEALARIPQPEPEESGVEFPEPAPQPMAMPPAPPFIAPATAQAKPFVLPPLPVPAQPAPVPAFLKPTPPAPPPVPVPSIPAPPVAITPAPPLPAPSVPPPVAPAPPAPPAPSIPPPIAPAPPVAATAPVVSAAAPQAEATGLALSGKDAAATAAPPSATQPIEEEALHALQQFFNDNSPDGPLLKSQEDEFIRMAVKLVAIVVPGVTFAQTDFSLRIRQLKDTFVLRKKLRNRLTLTEFKAYFRKTR